MKGSGIIVVFSIISLLFALLQYFAIKSAVDDFHLIKLRIDEIIGKANTNK